MSFFNDFANALESYPVDSVSVTITDKAVQTGTSGSVNVNEIWQFKVQVDNNGHVNMTEVELEIAGLNGAKVATDPAGPFTSALVTGSLTVNGGGGSKKTGLLYFKAPSTAQPAGTDLVEAYIFDWTGNIDHMFTNHTKGSEATHDFYEAQVFP